MRVLPRQSPPHQRVAGADGVTRLPPSDGAPHVRPRPGPAAQTESSFASADASTLSQNFDAVAAAPLPPAPAWHDERGIVIVGGAGQYSASLYVTLAMLRETGCTLPVEVWCLPSRGEMCPALIERCARFGPVTWIDGEAHWAFSDTFPNSFLPGCEGGWQLKAFAIVHSRFAELIYLDADCYPVRDPTLLLGTDEYRRYGAILWPDMYAGPGILSPQQYAAFGLEGDGRGWESGQMVLDKRRHWRTLYLVLWLNVQAWRTYRVIYGDKDTFQMAWRKTRAPRYLHDGFPRWDEIGFVHVAPDGAPMFVHRCRDKFRTPGANFQSTPQNHSRPRFVATLPQEEQAHRWYAEFFRNEKSANSGQGGSSRAEHRQQRTEATIHERKSLAALAREPRVGHEHSPANSTAGLIELLQSLPRLSRVVEIGCYRGASTEVLARFADEVVAVDHWPDEQVFHEFQQRIATYQHVTIHRAASPTAADDFSNGSFDLVYIDAMHDYGSVRNDLMAWAPKVRSGGWLAGHDYSESFPGLVCAVDEIIGTPDRVFSDTSWIKQRNIAPPACLRSLVINLESNPRRWKEFRERLPKSWPFERPLRFVAVDLRDKAGCDAQDACRESHLKALDEIAASGRDTLLMEDDCCWTLNMARVVEALDQLPSDWDCAWLGGHQSPTEPSIDFKSPHWLRARGLTMTHAIVYRATSAKRLRDALAVDVSAASWTQPIG